MGKEDKKMEDLKKILETRREILKKESERGVYGSPLTPYELERLRDLIYNKPTIRVVYTGTEKRKLE